MNFHAGLLGCAFKVDCTKVKLAAPKTPRDAILLFQEYRESEGIEGLLEWVDWSTSSPDEIRSAFGVTPTSTAEAVPPRRAGEGSEDLSDEARRLALLIIRSREFQANLVGFVIGAFPEKRRLSFVHIPKCGGTTINALLGRKFPWLNPQLVEPAWTDEKALFRSLRTLADRVQKSEILFISGHYSIRWYLDRGVHRAGDRMFTVIRHPYEMVFSQVNYIIKRFRQDPNLTAPDTRDWAKQLGLDRFEGPLDNVRAKSIAIELFDNPRITRPTLLTSYLGNGNVRSALEAIRKTGIEIVSLDSLKEWLDKEWSITATLKENEV